VLGQRGREQPPDLRLLRVGLRAPAEERLDGHHLPVAPDRTGDRPWAGVAGRMQVAEHLDRRRQRAQVDRRSVHLHDDPVGAEPQPVHGVDAPGPQAQLRDRLAEQLLGPRRDPPVDLLARRVAEERPLQAAHAHGRRERAAQ